MSIHMTSLQSKNSSLSFPVIVFSCCHMHVIGCVLPREQWSIWWWLPQIMNLNVLVCKNVKQSAVKTLLKGCSFIHYWSVSTGECEIYRAKTREQTRAKFPKASPFADLLFSVSLCPCYTKSAVKENTNMLWRTVTASLTYAGCHVWNAATTSQSESKISG